MKLVRPFGAALSTLFLTGLLLAPSDAAQDLLAPAPLQKVPTEREGEMVRREVLQGRALLQAGDERAVATLRQAAQKALATLTSVAGRNPLLAGSKTLPGDALTANLAQSAGEAHFYWGLAASRFAQRDESITALSRALRLARALPGDGGALRRDSALELSRILRDGLPLVAPDDALETIAQIAHGGLWTPQRFDFDPQISAQIGGSALPKNEFLVTDGKLFPPVAASGDLSRIPPFYSQVPADQLPGALHLDKMVAGYEKLASGPNRGQWRQIARVFYASPFLTRNRRDDLPRARDLCAQFLKVHALFENALGATNLFTRGDRDEGVTTLWLLEVSSLWPEASDVSAQPGALGASIDPKTPSTAQPWMALAGQMESNGGEIMFWQSGLARPETEWVRELFHEYGHVALPPFGGFRPPLEPYGNGVLGETLGALWAAPQANNFGATDNLAGGAVNDFVIHVGNQALPALHFFLHAGPDLARQSDGNREGWRYLQGLTTYLERVYGAEMLGRALTPLSNRAAGVSDVAARRSLMNARALSDSLDANWRDWDGKTLPIWLPGALDVPRSAQNLIARGAATLKRGAQTSALLYVPKGAESLLIEGTAASQLRAVGLPSSHDGGAMRVYFGGKSGWQSFSLLAGADTKISGARFEKKE